jgi:hypothetical protein
MAVVPAVNGEAKPAVQVAKVTSAVARLTRDFSIDKFAEGAVVSGMSDV